MSFFLDNLLIFARMLRHAGIDVPPGRLLDLVAAFGYVNLSSRDEVYHCCRALLLHRQEQLPIFDKAFAAFWRTHSSAEPRAPLDESSASAAVDQAVQLDELALELATDDADVSASGAQPAIKIKTWSDTGGLAEKDFGTLTADEIVRAREALSRLVWTPGLRRTRRWVRGRGARIDFRRAIGDSVRTGGEVVKLARLRRRARPRPLVLLCDVSGSMEHYSRMLLHFAHVLTLRHHRVEAFLFSTRLTRVTPQLRMRRPDEAFAAVAGAVPDWSGGTRIGGALSAFHQRWGRRALSGGPVVLLISDGWDRGDPEELRAQVARLQRRSHRLIWLNPLIGTAGYAPLTRGLQAALPYVDDFLASRTLSNLEDLANHLNTLT